MVTDSVRDDRQQKEMRGVKVLSMDSKVRKTQHNTADGAVGSTVVLQSKSEEGEDDVCLLFCLAAAQ